MNDVRIDGIRYVPESQSNTKRLSTILEKECPYLSRTVRDSIVKKFESDDVAVEKPKPKTKKPQNSGNSRPINIKNIKGIDEKGHVLYKQGRKAKSVWTIYHATEIRQWMNHGKLDGDRVKKLSEKFGVSTFTIYNLIRNLKTDEFNTWLDIMVSKNVIQKPDEKPNKEDMGWF